MAYSKALLSLGIPTVLDFTLLQYRLVKEDGTLAVTGEVATGVNTNNPNGTLHNGATLACTRIGVERVVASAAIAKGALVAPFTGGKARTAVATDHVCGVALEAAAADGDIIAVLLNIGGSVF